MFITYITVLTRAARGLWEHSVAGSNPVAQVSNRSVPSLYITDLGNKSARKIHAIVIMNGKDTFIFLQ